MFFDQRFILSDNAVLSDKSAELSDFRSGTTTLAIVAAEDALYVGSALPWCARYIEIGVANTNNSTLSVEYYHTTNTWKAAVDLVDLTAAGGKSLAQSGYIRFQRDLDYSWSSLDDSEDILPGTRIYNMYWLRLKWSADLSGTTSLKYIGHKFSNDEMLYEKYPDLNQTQLKEQFEAGKTNWDDQHYAASQEIVSDLMNRDMILSQDQILDPWKFQYAAVHQVAKNIYHAFGQPYLENKKEAMAAYKTELNSRYKHIDINLDAVLEPSEKYRPQGRMYR